MYPFGCMELTSLLWFAYELFFMIAGEKFL